jgi:hypothetical protein
MTFVFFALVFSLSNKNPNYFRFIYFLIMYQMQANASSDVAKDYLAKRKIPDLFEVNFN